MNVYDSSMASCLVDSGVLIAMIEEERLSRKKDKESYGLSTQWCADIAKRLGSEAYKPLDRLDSEDVVVDENPSNHHLLHAASAYIQSGFPHASILVMDGADEDGVTSIGIFEATPNGINEVIRYSADFSMGHLFDTMAEFGGLGPPYSSRKESQAGKMMGLATYCTYDFSSDTTEYLKVNRLSGEVSRSSTPLQFIPEVVERKFRLSRTGTFTFDFSVVAGFIQHLYEKSVIHLLHFMLNTLTSKNLIVTGGCGLNCTMNGKILRSGEWEQLFIPPLCSDAGLVLGNAYLEGGLLLDRVLVYNSIKYKMPAGIDCIEIRPHTIAGWLREGQVVAWFEGGSEYGPRALGHRSILANPKLPWMAYKLNSLKDREYWRPFAPVILDTHFTEVFNTNKVHTPHKYMLATEMVHNTYRTKYPAIVAPDGTSRPQVISDTKENGVLYNFMKEFNFPVLVNTSLNGKGEPICETLDDARRFTKDRNMVLVFVENRKFYFIDAAHKIESNLKLKRHLL